MSNDIEKGGDAKGATEKEDKGMSQMKEDCQVYITILLVTLLSTIVVIFKVVAFDMDPDGKYSSLFGSDPVNSTTSPLLSTTTSSVSA